MGIALFFGGLPLVFGLDFSIAVTASGVLGFPFALWVVFARSAMQSSQFPLGNFVYPKNFAV